MKQEERFFVGYRPGNWEHPYKIEWKKWELCIMPTTKYVHKIPWRPSLVSDRGMGSASVVLYFVCSARDKRQPVPYRFCWWKRMISDNQEQEGLNSSFIKLHSSIYWWFCGWNGLIRNRSLHNLVKDLLEMRTEDDIMWRIKILDEEQSAPARLLLV